MTNPFADITDPAILRAMVQDGVKCEECKGIGGYSKSFSRQLWEEDHWPCPTCKGTGRIPLSNPDLDGLAACWCEGWEEFPHGATFPVAKIMGCTWRRPLQKGYRESYPDWDRAPPAYTTSPDAAMRLQVKYVIPVSWIGIGEPLDISVDELCHYLTTCALIAALTEAIEK